VRPETGKFCRTWPTAGGDLGDALDKDAMKSGQRWWPEAEDKINQSASLWFFCWGVSDVGARLLDFLDDLDGGRSSGVTAVLQQ
jgi:hypothetical protein